MLFTFDTYKRILYLRRLKIKPDSAQHRQSGQGVESFQVHFVHPCAYGQEHPEEVNLGVTLLFPGVGLVF